MCYDFYMRIFIMLIFILLLVLFGGIAMYRLVGEDNIWVCNKGQWEKRGNPLVPPPSEPCWSTN